MNELRNKIVYIAGPLRLLEQDVFVRAGMFVAKQHPAQIVSTRGLFKDNKAWLDGYKGVLSFCNVMVIVSDNALVGKGVYLEWEYIKERKGEVYHYCESGGFKTLIPVKKLQPIDSDNWVDYAVIKY